MEAFVSALRLSRKAKFLLHEAVPAARAFAQANNIAAERAAKEATNVSRAVFSSKLSGRPLVPARSGRPTTSGQFVSYINWVPSRGTRATAGRRGTLGTTVNFDLAKLDSAAPYWLIQEIGTGESASILNEGAAQGVAFGGTVKSQVNRPISKHLLFAPGPGSAPTRSGGLTKKRGSGSRPSGLDNLFRAGDLDPKAVSGFFSSQHRIKREIKGKHYIQIGGKAGFRYFKSNVMAETKRLTKTR